MVVPPIGAAIITITGLQFLRVIFSIEACINFSAWLYAAKEMKDVEFSREINEERGSISLTGFFVDILETYQLSRKAGVWMFILLAATSPWVFNVDGNFQTVYATKVRQSPLVVIGFLSSINAFIAILLYIPIANLAEKEGRMNTVIKIRPFQYIGYIIYILAGTFFMPSVTPYTPLLVWGLRSAGGVGGPGWEVASIEQMPLSRLSTWQALQSFTSRLVGIPAPLVGGILWNIDPRAPFIWHLCLDAVFRWNMMRKIARMQKNQRAD